MREFAVGKGLDVADTLHLWRHISPFLTTCLETFVNCKQQKSLSGFFGKG
jgi:hypothetical protein